MGNLVFIEWNEVNAEIVSKYLSKNKYKSLTKLFNFPSVNTCSENEYESLEPWIQWVSVHTGKRADEHGIFRLGDIDNYTGEQIFELVEKRGYSVGAISAMNAKNKLTAPSFFVPDPWTKTHSDNSLLSRKIHDSISQAVNDNSKNQVTAKTYLWLLVALFRTAQLKNWPMYLKLLFKSKSRKWCKALFLDLLLSDIFLFYKKRTDVNFSTLFLNGFAHIQHHYFYNSKHYTGSFKNPDWYIKNDIDPFEDALQVYDQIFANIFKENADVEILVATGLQQVPFPDEKYMYRLRNHRAFLDNLGIKYTEIQPRMTSDFTVYFRNATDRDDAADKLRNITINGHDLFGEVDLRENSIFVMSDYQYQIDEGSKILISNGKYKMAMDELVFVAVKNGMHHQTGTVWSNTPTKDFDQLNEQHVAALYNYINNKFTTPNFK